MPDLASGGKRCDSDYYSDRDLHFEHFSFVWSFAGLTAPARVRAEDTSAILIFPPRASRKRIVRNQVINFGFW